MSNNKNDPKHDPKHDPKNDPKHDPKHDEPVGKISQEKPPGKYDVGVEDYEADGPSTKPGPHIKTGDKESDEPDLSGLTPSARERTEAEMKEGRERLGKDRPEHKSEK